MLPMGEDEAQMPIVRPIYVLPRVGGTPKGQLIGVVAHKNAPPQGFLEDMTPIGWPVGALL